uniref:type I phosphomannose isomerase catalytic subunit n=1 Tax=Flavobacterium sp. TaxID=239 RepID=UPI0040490E5C
MKFYPITFYPIIKERIWGGIKLHSFLNKHIEIENAGESWEISTVSNDVSIANDGFFKGKNLNEIINLFPEEILGRKVVDIYGAEFPLLFKFLDAQQDLSIQLHPNDELAKRRHNSFGKTEMWYVMQADENARIVVGFKEESNKKEYLKHLENKSLVTILNEISVKKGDVFLLETGTIHAIGAGIVIAEIQQTSDVTYRIYDWDRVDANGNSRELHTDLALEAINYNKVNSKVNYSEIINKNNSVIENAYFTTNIIPLEGNYNWNKTKEAFTVFMCTDGNFSITIEETIFQYKKGDTILIPAIIDEIILSGNATVLEISI